MAMKLFAVVMVAIALIPMTEVEAQTSCVMKLVPCADIRILKTLMKPSKECCNAIIETIEKELSCLCTIYNTPGLLSQYNFTAALAVNISRRCDIDADFSLCSASVTPPPKASLLPPPVPAESRGNDDGAGNKLAGYDHRYIIILSFVSTIFS